MREQISKEPFPLSNITDNSVYSINLTNHLVRRFYDSNNRVVAVFDDVVPKKILFALRKYFFQYDSSYVYNVYDPTYSEDHDNVNWVAQVPVSKIMINLFNTTYVVTSFVLLLCARIISNLAMHLLCFLILNVVISIYTFHLSLV